MENALSPYVLVSDWISVAKEVLRNLNEVSWKDCGTEVIRSNTEGQDHLEF